MALHHRTPPAHETTMLLKLNAHTEIDEERQSTSLDDSVRSPSEQDEEEDMPLAFPDDDDDAHDYSPRSKKHHHHHYRWFSRRQKYICCCLLVLAAIVAVIGYGYLVPSASNNKNDKKIILVDQALETLLNVTDPESGQIFQLWFRVWGRTDYKTNSTVIPIVFIHGGPGNAIADYFGNSNQRFFQNEHHNFFVVEVDQRGTGKSQPSVRDDMNNMQYYTDISIDKMCTDFEAIRQHLGIDKWLIWGGSFGSTLAINYGQRYPDSCLALIIRGIYLDTVEEVYAVYSRNTYLNNTKRLHEFDILYQYAADYVNKNLALVGSTNKKNQDDDDSHNNDSLTTTATALLPLDPNNAEQLMRVYAEMITNGDKYAVWHWFVFENNLMETDPINIMNPFEIDDATYPESQSVAFFETRLWLHGSFESPTSNLMNETKIHQLNMPLWICQGQYDEVCPPRYAQTFVNAMTKAGQSPWIVSRFVNGSHEDTDPAIAFCLKQSLREFVDYHQGDSNNDGNNMYNLAW